MKPKIKHTPGPWTVETNLKDLPGLSIQKSYGTVDGNRGEVICKLNPRAGIQGWYPQTTDAEDLANARLIATAPELLEAVRSMLLFIETYGGDVTANFAGNNNSNLNFYRALIAKATGGDE